MRQVITDPDLVRFISKSLAFGIYGLFITSFLGTIGIDTKPLVAGIGVSGFLVGFALKEVRSSTEGHSLLASCHRYPAILIPISLLV